MSKILVDRTEYEALCELRDGVFESMRIQHMRLQNNYADQKMLVDELRDRVLRLEAALAEKGKNV